MSTAILTIDDIVSANTPDIVDYLCENKICAVMFAIGQNVEKYYDEAIYAVKNGMIVGNHSYSHVAFSNATYSECVEEIEKTEEILNRLYKDACIPRLYRPFRFPYGDKGKGENGGDEHYNALQKYLRDNCFSKLIDTQITFPWYYEHKLNGDIDTFWTFDFGEYQLPYENDFTVESVYQRIHDKSPKTGGVLLEEGSNHIILFHAHDETEAVVPRYYEQFLDYIMAQGVRFAVPQFR